MSNDKMEMMTILLGKSVRVNEGALHNGDKCFTDISDITDGPRRAYGKYISFGYFDTLMPYDLGDSNGDIDSFFKNNRIIAEKQDGHVFLHPLNILRIADGLETKAQTETEETRKNLFFGKERENKPFLFVTMLHQSFQSEEKNTDQKYIEQYVKETMSRLSREEKEYKDAGISYRLYHSLDLSDGVLLWRAHSLRQALRIQFLMHDDKWLGASHTICGVNREALADGSMPLKSNISNEKIDMASLHMTIRRCGMAQKLVGDIEGVLNGNMGQGSSSNGQHQHPYFVLGSDDVVVDLSGKTTGDLLKLMHFYTMDEKGTDRKSVV